jgi:1-acyl-sn-glycerol-3-phosphate acyltransferase
LRENRFSIVWRTTFYIVSFVFFGVGSLIMGLVLFPVIHLLMTDTHSAQRACRKSVHLSFRLFIWFINSTRVLSYTIGGDRKFQPSQLVVANHPSLIDVIFIVAQIPDAHCVVKEGIRRNLFTSMIFRSTGWVSSADPEQMIERCAEILRDGGIVVMFPEGTRTVRGRAIDFKRGASMVFLRARTDLVPIYLRLSHAVLAKHDPWFQLWRSKLRFEMDIGTPLPFREVMPEEGSERQNSQICTMRLENLFAEQLRSKDEDGKPIG